MTKKNKKDSQVKKPTPNKKVADSEKDLQPLDGEVKGEDSIEVAPPVPEEKEKELPKGSPRFNRINNLNKK